MAKIALFVFVLGFSLMGFCDSGDLGPGSKPQEDSIFRIEFPINNTEPIAGVNPDTSSQGPGTPAPPIPN
jgi:hypothetical protein